MDMKAWAGQATTGAGAAVLLGALASVAAGQLTWQAAIPVLVGGAVSIIWPENAKLKEDASKVATDMATLVPVLTKAYAHGVMAGQSVAPAPAASSSPAAPARVEPPVPSLIIPKPPASPSA